MSTWFREASSGWSDAVLPAYNGGSIANIPSSVLTALETPSRLRWDLLPPVDESLLPLDLLSNARVIILIVIDGLGADALVAANERGDVPGLASAGHRATLTSVFPPTTAAATTSLQYGLAPGTHGMAGYTMYLAEIDQVFNMITWSVAGDGAATIAEPDATSFIRQRNVFDLLGRSRIDTVIVSNAWFETSPLTRVQAGQVRFRGYKTLADFPHRLIREVKRPGRRFVFGYWDGFDALGHAWGTESNVGRLELRLIDHALREGLFEPLSSLNEDVTVIVTADHGHIAMPRDRRLDLSAIPGLVDSLLHRPTGEPRQLGLTFQPGKQFEPHTPGEVWGDDVAALPGAAAIEAGLYGPPPHHPALLSRTGELLLLARDEGAFVFPGGNTGSVGGHGSLTRHEMRVPLLVWRYPGA